MFSGGCRLICGRGGCCVFSDGCRLICGEGGAVSLVVDVD